MYQIDFSCPVHVHFIGIGGISMSGLAQILIKEGFTVSGSDMRESSLTAQLEQMGASIAYSQTEKNIVPGIDVIVYTAAVHEDNPEFAAALSSGIPMLTRAQLLGEIMRNYSVPVAVAGTHGKTTTTSMISLAAMEAGLDPTVTVGGILKDIGGNIRLGSSGVFVAEACEYTNSFLSLFPKIGIILNIDADHLDFFKNLDHIRSSFHEFARLIPDDGVLILPADLENYDEFIADLSCRIVPCGIHEGEYHAADITFDEKGCASFTLIHNGAEEGRYTLQVPGIHNVFNAVVSLAACDIMGADKEALRAGLEKFTGADRRFQEKGHAAGALIIDDYAHHPTEIKATLTAAKNVPHKTLWCVFQPHTYTRTQALLDEFAEALSLADRVVLADIYAAREKNTLGISSKDLEEKIAALGTKVCYLPDFGQIEEYLVKNVGEGDLIITMGAGDIVNVGEAMIAHEAKAQA